MHRGRDHDERPPLPGAGTMEDYTVPFLWAAGALTFVLLFALWAVWGLAAPLLAGFAADRLMPRR